MSEAMATVPEQVWQVSMDEGGRTGTRQELGYSELMRTESRHWGLPHIQGLPTSTPAHLTACPTVSDPKSHSVAIVHANLDI